jgi:predicted NAD-dependent protein-ADP-ribosyltransferase YbiA (DUF1768 family)
MADAIIFNKVSAPWGWLGNMAPYPVFHYESTKTFRTTEALFQSLRFKDDAIIEEIRQQTSPMAAKLAAKKYTDGMVIEPRGKQDLSNMLLCLRLKISQHPELTHLLRSSGDARIVEDCTNRQNESGLYWGGVFKNGEWHGFNMLGNMWMHVRSTLPEV